MADYEDTKVTDLVINNMSQEKFEELKAAGELDPTQIYLTPTEASGGASLPDQTGKAGKFLKTNGTDVSWGEALVNNSISLNNLAIGIDAWTNGARVYQLAVGLKSETNHGYSVAVGYKAKCTEAYTVAIGANSQVTGSGATQIGAGTNSDNDTFKVANQNGNFEIMSADGTAPTDRFTTTPTTAGTYVPKLTIAGDGTATREWGPESGGAGGDYLPLSGGTLTGNLTFTKEGYANQTLSVAEINGLKTSGSFQCGILFPGVSGETDIGDGIYKWRTIYVTGINNGADIAVPTTGGTMALKEDIQEALKYISFGDYDESVSIGRGAQNDAGVSIGTNASASDSISIGYDSVSSYKGIAIGDGAEAGAFGIALGGEVVAGDTEFVVGLGGDPIKITDSTGLFPRERMSALVEVLPTAENGYTTVKNYGNGYVEISGCAFVGSTTETVHSISFPTGYQFDTESPCPYFASATACCKDDLTLTPVSANVTRTGALDFDVYVKPDAEITEGFYISWEVRGILLTE